MIETQEFPTETIKRVQDYANVEHSIEAKAKGYDIVEIKDDGWWCQLFVRGGVASGFTRRGDMRFQKAVPMPDCILIGEYLGGTNRAEMELGGKKGTFKAFDIIESDGKRIDHKPYAERRAELADLIAEYPCGWVVEVEMFPIDSFGEIWGRYVETGGMEGVCFKKSSSQYRGSTVLRMKIKYDMDYVITGVYEGKGKNAGRAGGLVGALMIDGKLKDVCRIGSGFSGRERQDLFDNFRAYRGRVLQVTGWQIFATGAMRHPTAARNGDAELMWRDDKEPEDCKLVALRFAR
jgi:ATP-dependent DNA ligase